jgi:hypothetical protein
VVRYGLGGEEGASETELFCRMLKRSTDPEAVPQSRSVGDTNDKQVYIEDEWDASNPADLTE